MLALFLPIKPVFAVLRQHRRELVYALACGYIDFVSLDPTKPVAIEATGAHGRAGAADRGVP
ncbi:hypothetical protein M8494_00555 [Serratia ureilytica]